MSMALRSFTAKKYRRSNAQLLTYLLLHPPRSEKPHASLGNPLHRSMDPSFSLGARLPRLQTHEAMKSTDSPNMINKHQPAIYVSWPMCFNCTLPQSLQLTFQAIRYASAGRRSAHLAVSVQFGVQQINSSLGIYERWTWTSGKSSNQGYTRKQRSLGGIKVGKVGNLFYAPARPCESPA